MFGLNDLICSFILKKERPSYYAFIIEWYYNGIAGIIPMEAGFRKVLIKPYRPKDISWFKCRYKSVHGEIEVSAKREGEEIELDVNVPDEIEYTVDKSNLVC